MKRTIVVSVCLVVLLGAVVAYAADMQALCSREKGLCGLETRALVKGTVLLGFTRDQADKPTGLHVHVFRLSDKPDSRAKISTFLFAPDNPTGGHGLKFMKHGPGEFMAKITWDMNTDMELAVRVKRSGMKDEVVYFKLKPGMAPETQ